MRNLCFGCLEEYNNLTKYNNIFFCDNCVKAFIKKHIDIQYIVKNIIDELQCLGFTYFVEPNINICSNDELRVRNNSNICKENILLGMYESNSIYILENLPNPLFTSTLIHEYIHIWQEINKYKKRPLFRYEGFADFITYKICYKLGLKSEIKRLLYFNKSLYLKGLLFFLGKEKNMAAPTTSSNIKSMKIVRDINLPDWLKKLGEDLFRKK